MILRLRLSRQRLNLAYGLPVIYTNGCSHDQRRERTRAWRDEATPRLSMAPVIDRPYADHRMGIPVGTAGVGVVELVIDAAGA
jgi:hypothetical protein